MEKVKLVKLLEVTEEDKWDFDPGYSEEMEMAEGSYGIMDYYDDDDDTYRIDYRLYEEKNEQLRNFRRH